MIFPEAVKYIEIQGTVGTPVYSHVNIINLSSEKEKLLRSDSLLTLEQEVDDSFSPRFQGFQEPCRYKILDDKVYSETIDPMIYDVVSLGSLSLKEELEVLEGAQVLSLSYPSYGLYSSMIKPLESPHDNISLYVGSRKSKFYLDGYLEETESTGNTFVVYSSTDQDYQEYSQSDESGSSTDGADVNSLLELKGCGEEIVINLKNSKGKVYNQSGTDRISTDDNKIVKDLDSVSRNPGTPLTNKTSYCIIM